MPNSLVIDKNLLKTHSCLACESRTELKVISAYSWARANGLDLTNYAGLNSLNRSAACLSCFSDKQIEQAIVAVELTRFGPAGVTTKTIRGQCCELAQLSESDLDALLLYLKAKYWNNH